MLSRHIRVQGGTGDGAEAGASEAGAFEARASEAKASAAGASAASPEREEEHETRRASRAKSPGRREGATRNERARRGAKGDADHDDSRSRETPVPTRAAGEAPEAPR